MRSLPATRGSTYGCPLAAERIADQLGLARTGGSDAHEPDQLTSCSPDFPEPIRSSADGVDGFHSRLSKCCNPLPGDQIRGYITRGSGLAIHRANCKNLAYRASREPDRIVDLTWESDAGSAVFRQDIEVVAVDRMGLLSHITAIISDADINIAMARAEKAAPHLARLLLTLEISTRKDLDHVVDRLKQLIDVVNVRRLTPTDSPVS